MSEPVEPLVKGGQGRSGKAVTDSALLFWICCAVGTLIVLAAIGPAVLAHFK